MIFSMVKMGGDSWEPGLFHQEGIAEKGKLGQFEVFGLDVIVDADQRVYLLEAWLQGTSP